MEGKAITLPAALLMDGIEWVLTRASSLLLQHAPLPYGSISDPAHANSGASPHTYSINLLGLPQQVPDWVN